MADLLLAVRTYLSGINAVKQPGTTGVKPPLYVDPREGIPSPAAVGSDLVVGVIQTGGIPPRPRLAGTRRDVVDFWLRGKDSDGVRNFEEDVLRPAFIDKVNWQMGAISIVETLQWRPLQRFSSNSDGYTFTTAYIFERRAP